MIRSLYKMTFSVGCNKLCSAWNKIVSFLLNFVVRRMCPPKESGTSSSSDIVISLTSYPARFDGLQHTLKPLLRQTLKPAKVILWLCEEEIDGAIPNFLVAMQRYGLEIKYCGENLRPHNKLLWSAREYPGFRILTVDDDIIYPEDLVEKLDSASRKHPKTVCCNMAHLMTRDQAGKLCNYDDWDGGAVGVQGPSSDLIALGVGGVLYPAGIFDNDYFDVESIKRLSLSTDDLWLKFYENRKGINVYKIGTHSKNPVELSGSQAQSLTSVNNSQSIRQNDQNIRLLEAEYASRMIDCNDI